MKSVAGGKSQNGLELVAVGQEVRRTACSPWKRGVDVSWSSLQTLKCACVCACLLSGHFPHSKFIWNLLQDTISPLCSFSHQFLSFIWTFFIMIIFGYKLKQVGIIAFSAYLYQTWCSNNFGYVLIFLKFASTLDSKRPTMNFSVLRPTLNWKVTVKPHGARSGSFMSC